jgi:hypothetical protein
MKPYNNYLYLYPPRPEFAMSPDRISYYEGQGYHGQYKKNGCSSAIAISPVGFEPIARPPGSAPAHGRWFVLMDRHKKPHRAWQLTAHIKEVFHELLPKDQWTYVVAELLNGKTTTSDVRDTLYIHDILVLNSTYLLGTRYDQRQQWLADLFPSNVEAYSHYVITEKVWRARTFKDKMEERFLSIKDPRFDEGIVLKKPDGILKLCDVEKNNTSWQAKCRYPTKIYNY